MGIVALLAVACGGESEGPGSDPEATGGDGGWLGTDAEAGADDGSGGTAPGSAGASDPGDAGAGGTGGSGGTGGVVEGGSCPGGGGAGGSVPPPMGGMAGKGSIPPPAEGCEPYAQSTGPDYCQIELSCENGQSMYTYCGRDSSDSMLCGCERPGYVQQYLVEGTTGLAACELIAEVCEDGKAVSFDEPLECTPRSRSSGPDYCERTDACRTKVEIADGVSAVQSRDKYLQCYRESVNTAFCFCSANDTYREYRLETASVAGTCDALQPLCSSDEEPVAKGEPECKVVGQSAGQNYCDVSEVCSQAFEIGDDVAVLQESRYASCTAAPDGGSRCDCSSSGSYIRFDVADAPESQTCSDAIRTCQSLDELEVTGEPECRPASQYADTRYCDASLQCAMDATIDGDPLRVYGELYVYCNPSGSAWSCTCTANGKTGSVAVDLDDPWDVCTEAGERCLEVVDVQPGRVFGMPGPGIPIPID
ncbi:MAG: hypothetical protein DIU78_011185 [Pseudomonadota bacterium]